MSHSIYLTFDLEEFDIPLEYGKLIPSSEQLEIGYSAMPALHSLLQKEGITATYFVTGNFASHYPSLLQELATENEIASHSFYHTGFQPGDLRKSKDTIENIINKEITGLRMPRMKILNPQEILKAGFKYDSSIHPTFLPGRYNNFNLPRLPYWDDTLLRIPASVSPILRFPLFWLSFKNFPLNLYLQMVKKTLKKDGALVLYFHPWEFANIKNYNLPKYISTPCGVTLLKKLQLLINSLKEIGNFKQMNLYKP
ncbi:MAG: DUF3473 domain-containing protein [Chitinophagaceae bacterium]|nr:DUF3473 domain-containing protein [Chitinophagaceae bacterium]